VHMEAQCGESNCSLRIRGSAGDAERLGMWEFLYYEARHFFVARATIGNKHFQNTIAIAVWTD